MTDSKARKGDLAIVEQVTSVTAIGYRAENHVRYRICVVAKADRAGKAQEFADLSDERSRQYVAGECDFATGKPYHYTWKHDRILRVFTVRAADINMHAVCKFARDHAGDVFDDRLELGNELRAFRTVSAA